MRIVSMISIATLAAATALVGPASAATRATATTALHIRSGPGPQYDIIGMMRNNEQAYLLGCMEGSLWCQVDIRGRQGWAYSKYLTAQVAGRPVVIAWNKAQIGIPFATYRAPAGASAETVGSAAPPSPAITGTLRERSDPAATQYLVNPPPTVRTYVIEHPAQPVYLEGEVVVGAGLPQEIVLQPVPDYEYQYAYVNRVPVLVQPQTRRIVYIYR